MYFEIKVRKWVELSSGPLRISFGCGPQHAVYLENKISLNIKFFFSYFTFFCVISKEFFFKKTELWFNEDFYYWLNQEAKRKRGAQEGKPHPELFFEVVWSCLTLCILCRVILQSCLCFLP